MLLLKLPEITINNIKKECIVFIFDCEKTLFLILKQVLFPVFTGLSCILYEIRS